MKKQKKDPTFAELVLDFLKAHTDDNGEEMSYEQFARDATNGGAPCSGVTVSRWVAGSLPRPAQRLLVTRFMARNSVAA